MNSSQSQTRKPIARAQRLNPSELARVRHGSVKPRNRLGVRIGLATRKDTGKMSYITDSVRKSAQAQIKAHTGKDTELTDAAIADMVVCAHFGLRYLPTRQGAPVNVTALQNLVDKFDGVDLTDFPAVVRTQVQQARKTLAEHRDKGFVPSFPA